MQNVLACIDASGYAAPVCELAAWAASRLDLPIELLHVVQRRDAVATRRDLSGVIGLGTKSRLLEELTLLEETESRLQVERGRALLAAAGERLAGLGAARVTTLHRHGGIVETIVEREADARIVVIGKRGAGHEFAQEHIGSKIERVVRASVRPILVASRVVAPPSSAILAFDGSEAAGRALERCVNSPLLRDLPVHIVTAGPNDDHHRRRMEIARAELAGRDIEATLAAGRPEDVIGEVVAATPRPILIMGAYGHAPLRTLLLGSTTAAMLRTVRVPVLLTR